MSEHQLRATFNTTRALKEILILLYFYETASAFSNQSFLKLLLIENQMTSFHTIVIFGLHSNKLLLLVLLLVCMWVCVCVCVVCVCVCVCVLTEQSNKYKTRVQVSDVMLRKSFCIKYLCQRQSKEKLSSWQMCKRVSIEPGKTTRSKTQLL